MAARLLQAADIEYPPTHSLLEMVTSIAIELDHPAYDCLYLALASERGCRLVTADEHLLRKLDRAHPLSLRERGISLTQAAALLA